MKLSNKTQALQDLIAPAVQACGVNLWGIEFMPQGKRSLVRIYIDKPLDENAVPVINEDGGIHEGFNIIHQTGRANLDEVAGMARISVPTMDEHYRPFGLLNALALRMAAGISSLVISRAGSGTIFEIASWGLPAIIVPIPEAVSHDQTKNAFSYARSGAAIVMEQQNLTPHILIAEIERIMQSPETLARMRTAAQAFAQPDAGKKIARVLIDIALEHTDK